jgi:quinoprotein dehydrogenase-associated probable ABC transporter substrate-binding protein
MHGLRRATRRTGRAAALAVLVLTAGPAAAQTGVLGGALELVDPTVLRVCADPRNLPFSDEAGAGFENALARQVAEWTGREGVAYTFFPQGMGFVRNTLQANRCDIIMGYAQGDELVQNTNAYYRTTYALVVPEDSPLAEVTALSDPRLQGARLGVVAGTPPATSLARNGLIGDARPYQLMVDTRNDAPVADMFRDLAAGEIDGALAWGPMAGWHAAQADRPMRVIPLTGEGAGGPRMTYRITMGVRPSDQEWKRQLNDVIREHQGEIDALLASYGVPLLDERDQPIAVEAAPVAPGTETVTR